MRHSEFWVRMNHHLGEAYARSYSRDQVLPTLGGRTVEAGPELGRRCEDGLARSGRSLAAASVGTLAMVRHQCRYGECRCVGDECR